MNRRRNGQPQVCAGLTAGVGRRTLVHAAVLAGDRLDGQHRAEQSYPGAGRYRNRFRPVVGVPSGKKGNSVEDLVDHIIYLSRRF